MVLPNHKEIHALQSFGDLVLQQPRFSDKGLVSPNQKENSLQLFGVLVLQQPGSFKLYQYRVNLLFCSRLGSTQHHSMLGDFVLQQFRFPDAGRASQIL